MASLRASPLNFRTTRHRSSLVDYAALSGRRKRTLRFDDILPATQPAPETAPETHEPTPETAPETHEPTPVEGDLELESGSGAVWEAPEKSPMKMSALVER